MNADAGQGRWRFVLEAIDPATECPAFDVGFEVASPDALRAVIDPHAGDETYRACYQLDRDALARLNHVVDLAFDPGSFSVVLRRAGRTDELPYRIHTNRELAMMLAGTKPLAAFIEEHPSESDPSFPEHLFDAQVKKGRFVKRDLVVRHTQVTGEISGFRMILYALPQEAWRIDAYIVLHETATRIGWNEGFERMQGTLLGYEPWQNDAYIERARRWRERAVK
jgi:hypothetical protein